MGTLESRAKVNLRKAYVQEAILTAASIGGLIALSTLGNIVQLLPYLKGNKYKFGYRARHAASRLAAQGLVRFVERRGRKYLEITAAGKKEIEFARQKIVVKSKKRKRWDTQWRMVIFDIPETRRSIRVRLRILMQELGFFRLQDSVFVFPYDCEELIALLKAELRLGKDVLYVIARQIENDAHIRAHFDLK